MNVNLMPYFVLWVALAAVVIGMIVWRKTIASHEDESLHVLDAGALSQQTNVSHKLEVIDKWGKILTAIAVAFGLVLGAIYMYQSWVAMSKMGV
ncbi:MAG TPA: hypothetical protein VG456_09790 [Candidatus Sulfopaludibacter sp.]|nr:hypothetical protein [Candidatus Sulfopaludibacter sp.]